MRWNTRLLVAILSLVPATAWAQLSVSVDDQDHLVLSASNLELLGLELQSPSASLLVSDDATPFQGVISNGNDLALFYSLGNPITLDGAVTLATKWDSTKRNDVLFQYGNRVDEIDLKPITGHQRYVDHVTKTPVIAKEIEVTNLPAVHTTSLLPPNTVLASPDAGGIYFYDEHDLSVVSITVRSQAGLLLPGGPSPQFDTLASNTTVEVGYTSETEVSLWGEFFVPVGWSGEDFSDLSFDLVTAHGEHLLVQQDISRSLPEPSSGLIFTCLLFTGSLSLRRRR